GRNRDGFWVARDAKGRNGGIFLLRASAASFARALSGQSGCATIFPTERFELDLKNSGNPLIPFLRPLMRLAQHLRRRPSPAPDKSRQRSSAAGGLEHDPVDAHWPLLRAGPLLIGQARADGRGERPSRDDQAL